MVLFITRGVHNSSQALNWFDNCDQNQLITWLKMRVREKTANSFDESDPLSSY